MTNQPTQQTANVHHLRIGDLVLTTLIDAYMEGAFQLLQNIDESEARRLHQESRRPTPPRITLNVYLLDTGNQKILIDTGFGPVGGGTGGRLLDGLKIAGYTPDDIDTVLITHVHPDHVGGLIDDDDRSVFSNATILVPAGELDYWGGDMPEDVSDAQKRQFEAAHRVIKAVGSQMQHLEGTEVLPGITRVPLPGHTPDHSGYRITSGNDQVLIWTDIVHLPQIQFPYPDATVAFDTDPAQAAATRKQIMAEVAQSREMIAGHHLDFPGVGYVIEDGDGYRFLPHVWDPAV
ncbi:MAG: MBL fold metallo-hydrolase [Salinisphaera sp.]|nr:MBL fold metallo-hydrolase [Salinisphaera sp.]